MENSYEDILIKMRKLNYAMLTAKEWQEKTIVYSRREVMDEAVITLKDNPTNNLNLFGVKNTNQISRRLVDKLQKKSGFLFHTIDTVAKRGRAIDVELINPLTGRVMTGSSSASCINILNGINDLAIGTDGGGSVLAPAISTGLYSIMAKGMGLTGEKKRISTDNISFVPGIGVISHNYNLCKEAVNQLLGIESINIEELKSNKIIIAIPKKGTCFLPNGKDMNMYIQPIINATGEWIEFVEVELGKMTNRDSTIAKAQEIFDLGVNCILTVEGPIDIYGLGDSVLGQWGEVGEKYQQQGGKYILKVANMLDSTAISIPTNDLATGVVLTAKGGINNGRIAMGLGQIIKDLYSIPPLFSRYFIEGYLQGDSGFM